MTDQDPKAISEHLLYESGRGMMDDDFDRFAACFLLPNEVATFDATRTLTTRDDIRTIYDQVRNHMRVEGVTQLVRHCVEAVYRDADTVHATHESRMLNGVRLVQQPFPAFSVLKRVDGRWYVASSSYAVADAPRLAKALTPDALIIEAPASDPDGPAET